MKRMIVLLALVAAIAALCAATAWAWGAAHPDSTWRYNERTVKSFKGHELMIHDALLMLKGKSLLPPGMTDNVFHPIYTSGTPVTAYSWGYINLINGSRVADLDVPILGWTPPYISSYEHYYMPSLPFLTAPFGRISIGPVSTGGLPGGGFNAKTMFMLYINGSPQEVVQIKGAIEPGAIMRFKNAVTRQDTIDAFKCLGYAIHYLEDGSMPYHMEWPLAYIPPPGLDLYNTHGHIDSCGDALLFNERLTFEQGAANRPMPYASLAFGGDAGVSEGIVGKVFDIAQGILRTLEGKFNYTQNMNDLFHKQAVTVNSKIQTINAHFNFDQNPNWTEINNDIRPLIVEGEDRIALLMYYVFWKAGYYHGASNPPSVTGGPTVFVRSPGDGNMVYNNNAYTIKADIADGHGVNKAEFFANGVLLGSKTAAPWTWDWSPSSTKATDCKITVKAYGNGGADDTTSSTITVIKGADSYYNKLNVGGSVSVVDPKDGHTATCVLTNVVSSGTRYAVVTVDGLAHTVNAGQMVKVNNGNSGLFLYAATVFDGSERFAELMIAPYQYPSVDILTPQAGENTGGAVVMVATNYCGKNISWGGIGNPPVNAFNLKTVTYNDASGATASSETFNWTMSGSNGSRTMTIKITDKLGATVSTSVTVNYNSSLPFLIYRGPLGDSWAGMSLYCNNHPRDDYSVIYYYNAWDGTDPYGTHWSQESQIGTRSQTVEERRQEMIGSIAAAIASGPLSQSIPGGTTAAFVADKNQYDNGTLDAKRYGTIYYREIYDRLAFRLGKDGQGRYRVWTSTGTPASRTPITCLHLVPLPAPTYPAVTATTITLDWKNLEGESGYQVQRSTDNVNWSTIASPGADSASYTNTGLNAGTTYYYRVIGLASSPCANDTSLSSAVTTTSSDGVTNGNFEGSGGWTFTHTYANNSCPLHFHPDATDDPYQGVYYGRFEGGGCTFYHDDGNVKTTFTVPSDALTLKYAIKVPWIREADLYATLNGNWLKSYGTQGWTLESFDITAYRGQSATLQFSTGYGCNGCGINCGIDAVSITGTIPAVTITSPVNGGSVQADSAATIAVTASDANGSINRVEFFVDGVYLGVDITSPYTCNWTPIVAKSYAIMAKAYDNGGNTNTATATVTATGIVGYWKLDASTGTIATDNSGNNNQGTLVNGPTWVAGQVNNALSFNGSSQYVDIPDNPSIRSWPNGVTVAIWAKSNTATWNNYGMLVSKRNSFILYPLSGSKGMYLYIYDAGWSATGYTSSKDLTQWHYYVGTFDNANMKIYEDGVLMVTTPYTGVIDDDNGSIAIGRDDGLGRYFNGTLDDARIYNKALSAADVLSLYNSQKTGYTTAATTYSWITASTATGMTGANKTVSLTLPFSFKYYGTVYSSVNICSNGFLSFTSTSTSSSPVAIPNTAVPNALVAPFWRALYVTGSGSITYSSTPDAFVVSWNSVRNLMNTQVQSFQVILRNTGEIDFQYKSTTADKPTVSGIEDQAGAQGLATSSTPANSTAIRFRPNELNFKLAELPDAEVPEEKPARLVIPTNTGLLSCAPNPFTGQTTINFQLAKPAQTIIKVYNINGQVVKSLVNECLRPGYHSVKWDGKSDKGPKVAAGVYLYRMQAGDYSTTRKLTVLR